MDNIYESNIEDMITELNDLKDNAVNTKISDLNKSQVSVQSMDPLRAVIHFNLTTTGLKESSTSDGTDVSDGNTPDDSDPNSHRKSQSGANDNKDCDQTSADLDHNTDQSFKVRYSRRTISESVNEDSTKGILKYSHSWIRRTVSESNCDSIDPDLDLLSLFWHSVEDVDSEDEFFSDRKPKKNVRFSDSISQTVFRPNSSILGRKLKNQKRAKNRKNSTRKDKTSDPSENKYNDGDCKCERSRQDSGYDSEDNVVHCDGNALQKPLNKLIETGFQEMSIE